MQSSEVNTTQQESQSEGRAFSSPRGSGRIGWLGIAIMILLAAAAVSAYWLMNRPKVTRQKPPSQATLVEVTLVERGNNQVIIRAMGTVVPVKSVQLSSRVGGSIVKVSPEFVPGGHFSMGQQILKIDPRDYELAAKQRASELAKARSDMKLEMGQQSVARREYEILKQEVERKDEELLLRRPQLASAEAAVASAQASYEQARLDLERTEVVAPFNALVISREVDVGSQVSAGSPLATLVSTDEYWVQVSIPVDQLKWIYIPGVGSSEGSEVRVLHETSSGTRYTWDGRVERLMPSLETQGRLAQLLVSVKDPLGLNVPAAERHPLILDSYVRVEIKGKALDDVVRIDRTSIRDGHFVWVMLPDGTLDIRKVGIIWAGNNHVFVSEGLEAGDLLIVSDLGAPVEGMALRTSGGPKRGARQPAMPKKQLGQGEGQS